MARKLKQKQSIRGIKINRNHASTLLSQFADDTALYLSYDTVTLHEAIKTLTIIEKNTGLMINYDKTLIYRIGSIANSGAKIYTQKNLVWTNNLFELLGVTIGNENDVDNYTATIN